MDNGLYMSGVRGRGEWSGVGGGGGISTLQESRLPRETLEEEEDGGVEVLEFYRRGLVLFCNESLSGESGEDEGFFESREWSDVWNYLQNDRISPHGTER